MGYIEAQEDAPHARTLSDRRPHPLFSFLSTPKAGNAGQAQVLRAALRLLSTQAQLQ